MKPLNSKPLNSIREAQESYRKKQEGTGDPLVKPTEGQGRNSEHYEEKRRRPGPQPSDKNPPGGVTNKWDYFNRS